MLYSTLCYLERGDEYLMLHRANQGIALAGKATTGKEGEKMQDCGKEQPGLEQLSKILQDSWKSPVRSNQESWNAGAGSGYSRDRQARWDGREMRTATTKVRREVYEVFRKLCQDQGRTPYGVLKELLLTWIEREAGRLFESGDPAVCAAVEALEEAPPWTGWHSSGGGS